MAKQAIETVVAIYQEGMNSDLSTFETIAPTPAKWEMEFHKDVRFVYEEDGAVQGGISVTPISVRKVYKSVAGISIYIRQSVSGKGVGSILLEALCEECRKSVYRMLQSSIFEKNSSSIRLHENVKKLHIETAPGITPC